MRTWLLVVVVALAALAAGCGAKPSGNSPATPSGQIAAAQNQAGPLSPAVMKTLQDEIIREHQMIVTLQRESLRSTALIKAAQAQQEDNWEAAAAWMKKAKEAAPEESVEPPESPNSYAYGMGGPAGGPGPGSEIASGNVEMAIGGYGGYYSDFCAQYPDECYYGSEGFFVPYGWGDEHRHHHFNQDLNQVNGVNPPANSNAFGAGSGTPVNGGAPPPASVGRGAPSPRSVGRQEPSYNYVPAHFQAKIPHVAPPPAQWYPTNQAYRAPEPVYHHAASAPAYRAAPAPAYRGAPSGVHSYGH